MVAIFQGGGGEGGFARNYRSVLSETAPSVIEDTNPIGVML